MGVRFSDSNAGGAAMAPAASATPRPRPRLEFGGPWGTLAIVVVSHLLVYYLWLSIAFHHAGVIGLSTLISADSWRQLRAGATPTGRAALLYLGFLALQWLLAWRMPGVVVQGLPVPEEGNRRHSYLCNGAASWYATLAIVAGLHLSGLLPLTALADQLGPILTVAVLFADATALVTYFATVVARKQTRMSGSFIYDFFMGAILNPRIGRVDLKLFTEARVSWILLFLLTLSAAAKEQQLRGAVSAPMIFMVVAHGLYTNACMKGEECIPTTWDIFHEKWGWMLIFWNLVGVPYVYCFNSFYILERGPIVHSTAYMVVLFLLLFVAYYVWDTSQSQKNRFRMQLRGSFVKRRTFPQLPWGTLENPEYLRTSDGGTLLIDGWWRYARKIHYSADILMALTWALACGFGGALPYLYPAFFVVMIMHRATRDEKRCRAKYGADWDRYVARVPYRFVPFLY